MGLNNNLVVTMSRKALAYIFMYETLKCKKINKNKIKTMHEIKHCYLDRQIWQLHPVIYLYEPLCPLLLTWQLRTPDLQD